MVRTRSIDYRGDGLQTRKAVLYLDTVSVETGSRRYFGSVSVSKTPFLGIAGIKDTFSL